MTHYTLVLNTNQANRRSLRIINPNTNADTTVLAAAVDKLIANDIFEPSRGALESLNRMELTTVSTTTVL